MRSRPLIALLLVVAIAGAAVFLLTRDDGPTVGEYRDQARVICQDADQATDRVQEPTRATAEAISEYFRRLLEANDATTKRFEALEPPEELEKAHADVLAANEAGVREVRRVIDELDEGGDPRQVLSGAQDRLQELSGRSGDAARRLGVPECADE